MPRYVQFGKEGKDAKEKNATCFNASAVNFFIEY